MRRGMFALLAFLVASTSFVNLLILGSSLYSSYLNTTAKIADAEEAFYRVRNFEQSFVLSAVKGGGELERWYSYWKPTYGYWSGECVQVDEPFDVFISRVLKKYGNKIFLEAYGTHESCLYLPVDYKGFKTYALIRSPLCINTTSPFSSC